jgi:hypothetical protein
MNDRDRLAQLQGLLARLERMPPSDKRDWMLREVRARAVDVETGVPTAPLRAPAQSDAAAHVEDVQARASRKPVERKVAAPPSATQRPVPASPAMPEFRLDMAEPARRPDGVDLLAAGGLLTFDEQPAVAATSRPWSGGLRG